MTEIEYHSKNRVFPLQNFLRMRKLAGKRKMAKTRESDPAYLFRKEPQKYFL